MSIIIYKIAGCYIGTAWIKKAGIRTNVITSAQKNHSEAFNQIFSLITS